MLKSLGLAALVMLLGYLWMPFSLVTHFLLWFLSPVLTKLADSGGDWFLTEFLPFFGATVLNLAAWTAILYALLKAQDRRREEAVVDGRVA